MKSLVGADPNNAMAVQPLLLPFEVRRRQRLHRQRKKKRKVPVQLLLPLQMPFAFGDVRYVARPEVAVADAPATLSDEARASTHTQQTTLF